MRKQISKNDGGPAFEFEGDINVDRDNIPTGFSMKSNVSLRDWFAGQALAGMCANPENEFLEDAKTVYRVFAHEAYLHADAMLAERDK